MAQSDNSCNMQFLSLDNEELSPEKIVNEYLPLLNIHLLEINDIRKKIRDNSSQNTNSADPEKIILNQKFKLIIDLISIYKDPKILSLIKEYQDEKEKERIREEEMEKTRKEIMQLRQQNTNNTNDDFFGFGNFWGNSNDKYSEDDEILSEVSEDEFDQDKVTNMLNTEYANINLNSMLATTYNITKRNYCEFETVDEDNNEITDVVNETTDVVNETIVEENNDENNEKNNSGSCEESYNKEKEHDNSGYQIV